MSLKSRQRYLLKRAERRRAQRQRRKLRKLAVAQPVLELLFERFPECFSRDLPRLPLKVGIREELQTSLPEIEPKMIRKALSLYTRDLLAYRAGFFVGTGRIDLSGNIVGEVTPKEAEHAGVQLVEAGLLVEAAAIARSVMGAQKAA